MKEAYYFSHDSNARHDPKILSMRTVYGSEGYGWYWIIIEMLREQDDFKIELTKYVWNALAMQTQCNADAMHSFVEDCINEFKLFSSDGNYFWSESLNRRMDIRNEKSEKARKAAEARWGKSSKDKVSPKKKEPQSSSNADAMQTHSDRNAIKKKKVKESKEKENIITTTTAEENPVQLFEKLLCRLSANQMESIYKWVDDFNDQSEIINEAIRIADDKNKRYYGFVEYLLKEWSNNNLSSLDRVKAYEQEKFNKLKKPGPSRKPTRTEKLPDWFDNDQETVKQQKDEKDVSQKKAELKEKLKLLKASE